MTTRSSPRAWTARTVCALLLVVTAGVGLAGAARAGLVDQPVPNVTCDQLEVTYGDPLTCTADGRDVEALAWPDGTTTQAVTQTHELNAIGMVEVRAVDSNGAPLAAVAVKVVPDIAIECQDGSEKPVYELAETDLNDKGWDYVYRVPGTDTLVPPGHPDHPNGRLTHLDRVEIGNAPTTSFCEILSDAATEFGGDFEFTIESPWEPTVTRPLHIVAPNSRTRWEGTQPGELVGTVTIGTVAASERRGVYMSGCS